MMTLRTGLIFVTILFAVVSMSFSQSERLISTPLEEPKKQPSQSEVHKIPVHTFQQLPNNPVSTMKPHTSEAQENSKNPKKERGDKTTTDWWLIGFTGVLVLVSLIQAAILYRQTLHFRRTERAYVFVTLNDTDKNFIPSEPSEKSATELFLDRMRPSPREPSIEIELSNEGKTPAILARVNTDAQIFSITDYPTEKTIPEYNEIPSGGFIIQSGKKFVFHTPISISISQWKQIQAKQLLLVCWGRIEYKDVLGNSHKTGFCWEYIEPNKCFNISQNNTKLNYYT